MNRTHQTYLLSQQKLQDALLELLETKDFAYISVRELCTKAGVHRSTFYLHYDTTRDLLEECIRRINQQFLSYYQEETADFIASIAHCPLSQLSLMTPTYLLPYLTYIRDHHRIFALSVQQAHLLRSMDAYRDLCHYILEPILTRFQIPAEKQHFYLAYYLNGIVAILQEWIQNDCTESMETMIEIILSCVRPFWKDANDS